MTTKRVSDFVFNGKGAVTLQIATLGTLLAMSWHVSAWKSDIEHKVESVSENRWTSVNMITWANELEIDNGELIVPDPWKIAKRSY